jgi:stearoyl-CoA desaturase (delta-9 desaturase)
MSLAAPAKTAFRIERHFNLIGLALIHFGVLVGLAIGGRPIDYALATAFYVIRMFGITAGYHRYFAHRAYKTSRVFQFVLALIGVLSTQKGPLWWAAIHRRHHRDSDQPADVHSPVQHGFWQSHIGWILSPDNETYDPAEIKDFYKYPELRILDRYHAAFVGAFIALTVAFGGLHGLCWWYCVSTAALMHATFAINSLAHVWGKRVYETSDDSRNSAVLAFFTLGEGWHNNHHRYMSSANQGFVWWQFDVSYYALRALSVVGVVWDLKRPPQRVIDEAKVKQPAAFAEVRAQLEAKVAKVREAASAITQSPADAE